MMNEKQDGTCFKQISVISHNKKKLDQVWKLIQETDIEIYKLEQVSDVQIKLGSLSMNEQCDNRR